MSYADFAARRQSDGLRLIDVREPHEFAQVRVVGAEPFALSRLQRGDLPEKDERQVALICRSGVRSVTAAHILEAHGFEDVINVEGGTIAAIAEGPDHVESGS